MDIIPGRSREFETAFTQAKEIISSMPGYVSHQLQKCIEKPDRYILLVDWRTLEDHTRGFRGSAQYQEWRRLLHHFYDPFPEVEHYEVVVEAGTMRKWLIPLIAIVVAVAATGACSSASPTPGETDSAAATSSAAATAEASTSAVAVSSTTEDSFRTLLTEEDLQGVLTAPATLTTLFFDYKAMAEGVPPSPVENMESWHGLAFEAAGGGKGMTLSAMDFDSEHSAAAHFEKTKSEGPEGMQEMEQPIGNASVEVEVNAQGIGSILVFVNGDKFVSIHTAQSDGQVPLISLDGLKELARLVASRQ